LWPGGGRCGGSIPTRSPLAWRPDDKLSSLEVLRFSSVSASFPSWKLEAQIEKLFGLRLLNLKHWLQVLWVGKISTLKDRKRKFKFNKKFKLYFFICRVWKVLCVYFCSNNGKTRIGAVVLFYHKYFLYATLPSPNTYPKTFSLIRYYFSGCV